MAAIEPEYTFTIPSIEDDTLLECRIYQPERLSLRQQSTTGHQAQSRTSVPQHPKRSPFKYRGVSILAHPYAPLGGTFDDAIILSTTKTLLSQNWVVVSFNFRGAGKSAGKTSWTGKGEGEDLVSVVGVGVWYLDFLRRHHRSVNGRTERRREVDEGKEYYHEEEDDDDEAEEEGSGLATIPSASLASEQVLGGTATFAAARNRSISLLLGGYSYGSLVLARLRPIATIIRHFQAAEIGTSAAEILLRARKLASQTVQTFEEEEERAFDTAIVNESRGRSSLGRHSARSARPSPVVVGGEETNPAERRRSRDSRRSVGSVDFVRVSADLPRRIKAHVRRRSDGLAASSSPEKIHLAPPPARAGVGDPAARSTDAGKTAPVVHVAYLLISPVLIPFTTTLSPTGATSHIFSAPRNGEEDAQVGSQLLRHPALALFGSVDSFTSSRKLMEWAERQAKASTYTNFEWTMVEGAGHFWREHGCMDALQDHVAKWIEDATSM